MGTCGKKKKENKKKYSPATTGENRLFTFYTLANISIPKKRKKNPKTAKLKPNKK